MAFRKVDLFKKLTVYTYNEVSCRMHHLLYTKTAKSMVKMIMSVFQSLRPALIDIREMCYHISDMPLCRLEKDHTYTLEEFQSVQYKQLEEVRET